jgi:dTDP-4-dehydrorhamnose reductase
VRILVLGANGMLGHRATALLSQRHDVVGTLRSPDPLLKRFAPRAQLVTGVSVESPETVSALIDDLRPDAVINCIGIVKQKSEAHEAIPSIRTNSLFPHQVAEMCQAAGARFVHVSTDCVFTGDKGGYLESDAPDAPDLYGRSKLLGEVLDVAGAVTVRTSIVGWELSHATGVLEWFAGKRGGSCDGYTKAVFSGLATSDLVDVFERLCSEWRDLDGLWHVSTDPISKYELLKTLDAALGWRVEIDPKDEPVIDRSLDSTRFRSRTGWSPRPWAETVVRLAAEREVYEGALHT